MVDAGPFGIGNRSCIMAAIGKRFGLWSLQNHFLITVSMSDPRWTFKLASLGLQRPGVQFNATNSEQTALWFQSWCEGWRRDWNFCLMTIWVGKSSHSTASSLRDGNVVSHFFWSGSLGHVWLHSKEQLTCFRLLSIWIGKPFLKRCFVATGMLPET